MVFDTGKAARTQSRLAGRLSLSWEPRPVRLIAGADCGYDRERNRIKAVVAVFRLPDISLCEVAEEEGPAPIPYIPGFLNFREGPVLLRAFRRLKTQPDVTLLDGNGLAHPRNMGLASYIGVLLDIPTVGCAKNAFFPATPPLPERGSSSRYLDGQGRMVGICLRTRTRVKPVFVSPGHRVDFTILPSLILDCCRFRIPEPLRQAHVLSSYSLRAGPGPGGTGSGVDSLPGLE